MAIINDLGWGNTGLGPITADTSGYRSDAGFFDLNPKTDYQPVVPQTPTGINVTGALNDLFNTGINLGTGWVKGWLRDNITPAKTETTERAAASPQPAGVAAALTGSTDKTAAIAWLLIGGLLLGVMFLISDFKD